jgi:putative hemolysin
MSDFLIKIAKDSKEVEDAQRLRYEVFNLELKKGLASGNKSGLDHDEYDPFCDHVLIVDKNKNLTVGTYRLLLRSHLGGSGRFYSENEFDLRNIRKLEGEILEMGRSCVHKDYRSNAILFLLWQRILSYVEDHRVRYIIGCPSFMTMDPAEVSRAYTLLKKSYLAPEEFRVAPEGKRRVPGLNDHVSLDGREKKIFFRLPMLIRSYLKIGAWVCGEPACDPDFGCVDFFMLLEVARISDAYLRRFRVPHVPRR